MKSTCELPTGCAGARHGATEGDTGRNPEGTKWFGVTFPCTFALISHSTLRRSLRDVFLLQYYRVRTVRILYLILAILQQFTSAFGYIAPHTKFQKSLLFFPVGHS